MDIIQESFSVPILMVPEMQLYVEDVTTTFLRSLERRHRRSDSQSFWMNLWSALDRQKIKVETGHRNLLVYTDATEQWAISLARSFRAKGKNVEMMKRNSWDERETFEAYGKRSSVASMLYLREDRKIEVINLQTGEEKLVNTKKKTKQQ